MTSILRAPLLALLALPLAAQSFSAGGALLLGTESLKKATNSATGFALSADWRTAVPGSECQTRVGLTLAIMPGSERNGLKTSLGLSQAYGDLMLDTPWRPLRAAVGLSVNHYRMTRSGVENVDDPQDVDHHFPVRDVKGLKLGLRVGLTWDLTERLALEALLQQTELAGKDLEDPLDRRGGINPAWLQVGLRYRF